MKPHYYGDLIRKLFLISAVFMLIMLPFMNSYLEVPVYISILAAIGISVFAGITNPKQTWVAFFNLIIAISGTAVFEYQAVMGYANYSIIHKAFWTNQLLALLFVVALYYSTKTVRGMIIK